MRDFEIPARLSDRYVMRRHLGSGGNAAVYGAWDEHDRAWRAVKVLPPHPGISQRARLRFEREAHLMARLRHRTVVRTFEHGRDGQHHFLVMELMRGGSLEQHLARKGALSPARALACLDEVLAALCFIHAEGVMHRDLKPGNVLFDEHGKVKLADFGLARREKTQSALTAQGVGVGTVAYCPPEQLFEASDVDFRADIYGAGATFIAATTATVPETLFLPGVGRHTALSAVPRSLRALLDKATDPDADLRYQSAAEMRAAVGRLRARYCC